MGPITLFDKSFLQSLSVDESVWFDHFFLTNVAPIFYVETLADLDKPASKGRSAEQEVIIIAEKFPDMHGMPCAHHAYLCISNLLGISVPLTGQIPVSQGRPVKYAGKTGAIFQQSPESKAFSRWQDSQFREIERLYAHSWRQELQNLDLREIAGFFQALGINEKSCRNLQDSSNLARATLHNLDKQSDLMSSALIFLDVPYYLHHEITERWSIAGRPPLFEYAPYAAFVLTVKLFFYIALAANLISSKRPSNHADIAYLFYLPFCMMFVSNDMLHRRCAPLFLRHNQQFVWGQALKRCLGKINEHYLQLPETTKEKGVLSFASDPPPIENPLIERLWNQLLPKWQETKKDDSPDRPTAKPTVEEIMEQIKAMEDAPPLSPKEIDFDPQNVDGIIVRRRTRKIKGSWRQIPN
jgi:hypothetical protein